jgi:hypothetical protein
MATPFFLIMLDGILEMDGAHGNWNVEPECG